MGKKGKHSSKSKPKQVIAEEVKRENSPESQKIKCSVCRQEVIAGSKSTIQCNECKRTAHLACYFPMFPESKKFVCDMCQIKKRKVQCILCKNTQKTLMMKNIGENNFVHPGCAFFSPHMEISSYSTMKMVYKKNGEKEATQCQLCKEKEGSVLKCILCPATVHYRCMIEKDEYELLNKWLDKCEKQNYLLHFICLKKQSVLQDLLHYKLKNKTKEVLLCPGHSEDFSWCFCDVASRNDEDHRPSVLCEICNRSAHQQCSGIPAHKIKKMAFNCQGCKKKDIFLKELKIYEAINEVIKLENEDEWTDYHIRILNSISFEYSVVLERKIVQHLPQIEKYFIKKELEQIPEEAAKGDKILPLIMFVLYEETEEAYSYRFEDKQSLKLVEENILANASAYKYTKFQRHILATLHQIEEKLELQQKYKMVIEKLRGFISECTSETYDRSNLSQIEIISKLMKQISDGMHDLNWWKRENKEFKENSVFKILVKNRVTIPFIEKILCHYKILKKCLDTDNSISEDDYNLLLEGKYGQQTKQENIVTEKVHNYFKQTLTKMKIKYKALDKELMWKEYNNKLKNKYHSVSEVKQIQNSLLKGRVNFNGYEDNVLKNISINQLEFNIMTKKLLKLAQQSEKTITDIHMKLFPKINDFFSQNKERLAVKSREMLHKFIIKLIFHYEMVKKVNRTQMEENMDVIDSQEEILIEDEEKQQREYDVIQKVMFVFDHWNTNMFGLELAIMNLGVLAQEKIAFSAKWQYQKLERFVISVLRTLREEQQSGKLIKGKDITRIYNIIIYFKLEEEFSDFFVKYDSYRSWYEELKYNGLEIPGVLENLELTQNLIKDIEQMLSNADFLELNLFQEKTKLCILKQWCKFSEKILSFKRKPSINAVQNLKILAEKIRYPSNAVKKRIISLDAQGKALNIQILKFLDKPKIPEFMEIYDQLTMIRNKIAYEEGLQMKKNFQNTNLDISAEIQQLESQLKEFEDLPKSLKQSIEKGTLKELQILRQKYLNTSIRHEDIYEYELLLKKILQLKSINFTYPITRKQYYQLLSIGGSSSLMLLSKTQPLYRAYKLIEKAENQLLTNPLKRRNYANLLSLDERKIKELKQDLKYDQVELNNLQKARANVQRLRQNYQRLRQVRAEIDKFQQIQDELLMNLFNTRDLVQQISNLKKEHGDLIKRFLTCVPYGDPTNSRVDPYETNIYRHQRGNNWLERYITIGIRHPIMDMYERDCKNFKQIEQIFRNLDFSQYRKFTYLCMRFSEWARKNYEVIRIREDFFDPVYQHVKESDEPQIQLCRGLMEEAFYLRQATNKKRQYLDIAFEMMDRLKKYEGAEEEEEMVNSSFEDDQDSDEFDGSDIEDDFGEIEDSLNSDDENEGSGKRQRDNNQIVLDDD